MIKLLKGGVPEQLGHRLLKTPQVYRCKSTKIYVAAKVSDNIGVVCFRVLAHDTSLVGFVSGYSQSPL